MLAARVGPEPVEAVLKRRGFGIAARGNKRDVLLPLDSQPALSGEQFNEFRRLFDKSTFRKLIRQITSAAVPGTVKIEQLAKTAGEKTDEYVTFLTNLGVVERASDGVRLTCSVDNIGPTLEWYVADLCQREFDGSAEWSVKLSEFRYGDCDVLAWLPPNLIYIETKSSRPAEITDGELRHFLQRGEDLAPELAVLLIDTESDLRDLIERLFQLMLPVVKLASGISDPDWRHDEKPFIAPQTQFPGICFGYRRFYVTNSEPSIQTQLSRCFRHYNSRVKGQTFWGGPPANLVTGSLEP
ncbi:MAG: hypothetical protein IH870_06195 [Chloroflexi bacterium]|nr:hypothetical protein [Chloroflexota bacterium]